MNDSLKTLIDQTPQILLRYHLNQSVNDPKFPEITDLVLVPPGDYDRCLTDPYHRHLRLHAYDPALPAETYMTPDLAPGLLYLPYPYLVPGGRFNEMYGWDSAFPVFAWAKTHPRLIREQVDNQLYQIRHYGRVLNSNRAYHLGRSHPPLLSSMVMAVFEASEKLPWSEFDPEGLYEGRLGWLREAFTQLEVYHRYWITDERLAGTTGLSRYWDDCDSPAPEVIFGEPGHFDHALDHFRRFPNHDEYGLFYDEAKDALTPIYYRADRAMRASGFDPTGHWGYGAVRCFFYAPVCLNSLLFKMEQDMAKFAAQLPEVDSQVWLIRADQRRSAIMTTLWHEDSFTFQDYDFVLGRPNGKLYANVFHTLFAGVLDPIRDEDRIRAVVARALQDLEHPYGLSMSTEISGSQWDHPYGWPPMHYIACAGLARYGFHAEAARVAQKFCALAESVFETKGSIFEKYNVIEGNDHIHVVNGYSINVSENGTFLWTAAVLSLLQGFLPAGLTE